jgi:hypothetical protein
VGRARHQAGGHSLQHRRRSGQSPRQGTRPRWPVVALQANGGVRAEVSVDETVAFTATIEVPPGAGKVVAAEWDFAGVGNYPINARIDKPETLVSLSATFAFAKPGTYFPVLRATSQRQGDMKTLYGRIQNLGRVRVVVR